MRTELRATARAFGQRVRAHRVALEISQETLGRLAGMTGKFIGEIERGSSNPGLETMLRVARALDCGLTDLLPDDSRAPTVTLRLEDVRRAQEALTLVRGVLANRKRVGRAFGNKRRRAQYEQIRRIDRSP